MYFFCLQVDGPTTRGIISGGGGPLSRGPVTGRILLFTGRWAHN